jgi:hypothetical protein
MEGTEGNAGKSEELGAERTGFTAHCAHCRAERLFVHVRVAVWRHALLAVLTGGLWLMVWAALMMGKWMRPWRCAVCGWHKAEFRKKSAGPIGQDGG